MWGAHGVEICENCFERESVLFISTQFSILYTSMYSPAEAATTFVGFITADLVDASRSQNALLSEGHAL